MNTIIPWARALQGKKKLWEKNMESSVFIQLTMLQSLSAPLKISVQVLALFPAFTLCNIKQVVSEYKLASFIKSVFLKYKHLQKWKGIANIRALRLVGSSITAPSLRSAKCVTRPFPKPPFPVSPASASQHLPCSETALINHKSLSCWQGCS